MTPNNLATTAEHLTHLTPPGPWEVHHDVDDTNPNCPSYYPFLANRNGELDMDDEDTLSLAALAPSLADELIRVRGELAELISGNPTSVPTDHLARILNPEEAP